MDAISSSIISPFFLYLSCLMVEDGDWSASVRNFNTKEDMADSVGNSSEETELIDVAIGVKPHNLHPNLLKDSLPVNHVLKLVENLMLRLGVGGLIRAQIVKNLLNIGHNEGR